MHKEYHFSLTDKQITAAEKKRTQGFIVAAAQETRPAIEFPFEKFPDLSKEDQTRLLMAARIHVVSTLSEAKKSFTGPSAATRLETVRDSIVTVYRNPVVQEAVPGFTLDTHGNPYEFGIEMGRDEVSYDLTLAALTGNSHLLEDAVTKLDSLIERAGEPTAKTLTQFERDRLVYQSEPTEESFAVLRKSYRSATNASEKIGSWERVATIASRYAIDAKRAGNAEEAAHGYETFLKAVKGDKSTVTIFEREEGKATRELLRDEHWKKTTPPDADYSTLQLP